LNYEKYMKQSIPEVMKAVRQYEAGGKLEIAEVPVPKPGKGEVLVKMAASPMNPSDLSFLNGTYVSKPKYPVIPGIEGSGLVVAAGKGVVPALRLGKRVTCSAGSSHGGTWAEYMLTPATKIIPITKDIEYEQGAMLIVNPMTALAFMEIVKAGKHRAVVNNTAASVLGQMLARLCKKKSIPLINIVRRNEHVCLLSEMGEGYVLNSAEKDFDIKLKELAERLQATLFLDAVGGGNTSRFVDAAPFGSTIMVYSNMSGEPFIVDPRALIQGNKRIENFYLGTWASQRNILQNLSTAKKVQELAAQELRSKIQRSFPMEEAQKALEFYKENMSGGKVLIKMH
jgi:NADPH:quinone reductase-like Zn-dependent oxidoreductase